MKTRIRIVVLVIPFLPAARLPAAEPAKPPPKYQVKIEHDVMVRMRDGARLATDLYIPMLDGKPVVEKLPAVLQRTPYNKAPLEKVASFFASHGYLSAVQDCRGRYHSEGTFFPFVNEATDGYDCIEWLAKHPACNGKVGMFGCSYLAWVQLQAATQRPPSLKTMIPFQGPNNGYHYSMHTGGAIHLGLLRWCLSMSSSSKEAKVKPEIAKGVQTMFAGDEFLRWAARTPWKRGATPLANNPGYEDAAFKLFFENSDYNDFWRQPGLGMDEYFDKYPDIPILWMGGWYDWYPRSISDGYQKMVARKHKYQYLLMGAWTHNNFEPACGDVYFGFGGRALRNHEDYWHLELRWFDHWLKDDRSADIGKPVQVFVMGGGDSKPLDVRLNQGGQWHHGDAWPPKGVQPTAYYFQAGGGLSREKPSGTDSSTSYTYDPRNTISSTSRCFTPFGKTKPGLGRAIGPKDQIELETLPGHGMPGMPIASRPDALVFQTEPLTKNVVIAGNVKVVLYVQSDAPDTDFFVKLIDVHPATDDLPVGFALPLTDGVLRMRYRDSFSKPSPMKRGQVYKVEFPLEPTANVFKTGHRIRIDVCSSNFPAYDINRNTGNPSDPRWRIAENTVFHSESKQSSIILPMAPATFISSRRTAHARRGVRLSGRGVFAEE
ncbi:MAG TPA: CocE/NonD family hydrolase [Gemmataceae bacterium]|nr:CocE/NonD family hydrolase [Gemmataceae bacterium]